MLNVGNPASKYNVSNKVNVSSKWKSRGAQIINEPFIANIRIFLITGKMQSSFPKWYEATIKKMININSGNKNHKNAIKIPKAI